MAGRKIRRYTNYRHQYDLEPLRVIPSITTQQLDHVKDEDKGKKGTCSIHSIKCGVEGMLNYSENKRLRFCISNLVKDIRALTADDYCPWDVFAFFAKGVTTLPDEVTKQVTKKTYRIGYEMYTIQEDRENWEGENGTLLTPEGLHEEIVNNGPVIATFAIGPNFGDWNEKVKASNDVYDEVVSITDNPVHMVTLIGSDQERGYFTAQNSYGSQWGLDGTFQLSGEVCYYIHIPRWFREDNLKHWLTQEKDQFVIRANCDAEVFLNNDLEKCDRLSKHSIARPVQWSPLGTYLVTLYQLRVVIWAGNKFTRLMHYDHLEVDLINFSPSEKYLVTYSSKEESGGVMSVLVKMFDVETGEVKKESSSKSRTRVSRPPIKWGGDKYFAYLKTDSVHIFETEKFKRVGKILEVKDVSSLCWSPTDPILALYVRGVAALVRLISIPSTVTLREEKLVREEKLLENVRDCTMYWQSNGKYLTVKVDKYTESTTYTELEIFCIREPNIPSYSLELDNKYDEIIEFAWEPKGDRFAVIHGDSSKHDVSFYSMVTNKGSISKLKTLEDRPAKLLFWSPAGENIILSGLNGKEANRQLELYNVKDDKSVEVLHHMAATDLQWNPSGSRVATFSSSGFSISCSDGKLLYSIPKDNLFEVIWRPRPLVDDVEEGEGS